MYVTEGGEFTNAQLNKMLKEAKKPEELERIRQSIGESPEIFKRGYVRQRPRGSKGRLNAPAIPDLAGVVTTRSGYA